jgi:hypothetical protein
MKLSKIKYLLFLIAIILFFFYPFLLQGKIPIPGDTIIGMYHPFKDLIWDNFTTGVPFKNFLITDPVRQLYVWKKLAIEIYQQKQWPLWNPYTFSGTPLLANFQSGAFYPLNFLFFILDFNSAWGIYIFLQPILAGLFMYFFLKSLRLKPPACALGSLVFIFSGFFIAWLEWGNIGHTALWLPLALLSIEKIIQELLKKQQQSSSPLLFSKWLIVFLTSLVCAFFAGHLQTSFYLLIFVTFYLLFRAKSIKKIDKIKFFFNFSILYLLFFMITSIQWLPTLEFINLSNRVIDQAEIAKSNEGFLPYQNLLQLLIPDFFGHPATLNYWGKWNYAEFVSFIGVIPLFFVLFSLLNLKRSGKHKKTIIFFFLMAVFSLLFALPTPVGQSPVSLKIPLIASAQPSRLIFLIDFSLACLSSLGLQIFLQMFKEKETFKKILLVTACFIFFFIILWGFLLVIAPRLLTNSLLAQNIIVSQRNSILPTILFFFLFLILVISQLKKDHPKAKKVAIIALFLLTLFDLLRFSFKFTPFSKRDWIFPRTQTINFLSQEKDLYRYMTVDRRIFPPNFSIYYGLKTVDGYDPLYLFSYADLITQMETGKKQEIPASFNRIIRPGNYQSDIADKLSVKYILALNELADSKLKKVFQEGETRIYENTKVKPLLRFNMEKSSNKIEIKENFPGKIFLETYTQEDNQLIFATIFYPGWQAKINGHKTPLSRTKENLISLNVPARKNQIELFYLSESFKIALVLSSIGILSTFLFFSSAFKKNKAENSPSLS